MNKKNKLIGSPVLQDRRGLQELYGIVLSLVIIGLLLGVGLLVLGQFTDTIATTAVDATARTANDTNDSVIGINYVVQLAAGGVNTSNILTITDVVVTNKTGKDNASAPGGANSAAIQAGNYTFNQSGQIVLLANSEFNSSGVNVSYTASWERYAQAYQAVNGTLNATNNIPAFLPIIVIALVAALILGIVITRLAGGKRGY